jgi:hypothetical protein
MLTSMEPFFVVVLAIAILGVGLVALRRLRTKMDPTDQEP